jgi:hypothetical protein
MFTKAFWSTALEVVLTAFVTSFAASQVFVTGFNARNFEVAATTAVGAAVAAFLKQLGAVQTLRAKGTK